MRKMNAEIMAELVRIRAEINKSKEIVDSICENWSAGHDEWWQLMQDYKEASNAIAQAQGRAMEM